MINQEINDERLEWARIQGMIQNSVVQIVAQVATFNWCEPYRVNEQQEVRGTGFFIDREGHLVTNAHVVDQAKTIWIHLPILGKKVLFAHVVGFCPDRDLALLRIDEQSRDFLRSLLGEIVPLTLGDSDTALCTDGVLVFGYPLGQYGIKSTMGIVSGRESDDGHALIQISAPINPGNSGGPVFNDQGEVIGVAVYVVPFAQSVGYAIPINELHVILDELYTQRFVRKALLGIQFNFASDEHAQLLGNPVPGGCYINRVYSGSLLEKVGVREGDMVYEINGFCLDVFGEVGVPWNRDKISLYDLVSRLKIGDQVDLVVYRNGVRHNFSFIFELVTPYPIRFMYPHYETVRYEVVGGMVIMQLTDNHLSILAPLAPTLVPYLEIENKVTPRVVITHIFPGSVVQQARCFDEGDVIAQVNGIAINTLEDVERALFAKKESNLLAIKTDQRVLGVFSLDKIKNDEERLSRDFAYPISPIGLALLAGN
jgi:serine protease Do